MPSPRKLLRGSKRAGQSAASHPGVTVARIASKLLFVLVLMLLILYSIATDVLLLGVLASFVVGLMLRAILPTGRLRDSIRSVWSGEAGESAYETTRRKLK